MKELLDVEDARALLVHSLSARAQAFERTSERIAVATARGRISAKRVATSVDVPVCATSAMDGYAVCSADPIWRGAPPHRARVAGASRAGHPPTASLEPNTAMRIFTGAVLPAGSDAVVIQENTRAHGDGIDVDTTPEAGDWVREPGNDVKRGTQLIAAGHELNAFDLARLTSCGVASIDVRPKLRVAIFSTGDELRDVGQSLAPGDVYDSNRLVLRELLAKSAATVTDLGIVADDESRTVAMLESAAHDHDAILTSGGVSVGDADFVRRALERVGKLEFWKLALRPGKPIAYGSIGACAFFGLPGNPVSTIVTYLLIVKPALAALAGAPEAPPLRVSARARVAIAHEPGRAEYQRGTYSIDNDGIHVQPTGDQGSNRIDSFTHANCLIEVPKENPGIPIGARVQILPFDGLLS